MNGIDFNFAEPRWQTPPGQIPAPEPDIPPGGPIEIPYNPPLEIPEAPPLEIPPEQPLEDSQK